VQEAHCARCSGAVARSRPLRQRTHVRIKDKRCIESLALSSLCTLLRPQAWARLQKLSRPLLSLHTSNKQASQWYGDWEKHSERQKTRARMNVECKVSITQNPGLSILHLYHNRFVARARNGRGPGEVRRNQGFILGFCKIDELFDGSAVDDEDSIVKQAKSKLTRPK